MDAIQDVSVQTSNFAAEYGQVGGGYFNFTTKSGTSQLHGSAYDYFVNEALNAGLPFTDEGAQNPLQEGQHIRNAVRRNDYGFTVGGPIRIPKVYNRTNRTFFFFNFEQFRQNSTISNGITSVPTVAYRNGNFATSGCFAYIATSNSCGFSPPILNTATGQPAVDAAGEACPKPGSLACRIPRTVSIRRRNPSVRMPRRPPPSRAKMRFGPRFDDVRHA